MCGFSLGLECNTCADVQQVRCSAQQLPCTVDYALLRCWNTERGCSCEGAVEGWSEVFCSGLVPCTAVYASTLASACWQIADNLLCLLLHILLWALHFVVCSCCACLESARRT
jgi:hypothetical protein